MEGWSDGGGEWGRGGVVEWGGGGESKKNAGLRELNLPQRIPGRSLRRHADTPYADMFCRRPNADPPTRLPNGAAGPACAAKRRQLRDPRCIGPTGRQVFLQGPYPLWRRS